MPRFLICFLATFLVLATVFIPAPSRASSQVPAYITSPMLNGASCVSSAVCYAVGSYVDARTQRTQAFAMVKDGASWAILPELSPPGSYSYAQFNDVSCTAIDQCVAVGEYLTPERKSQYGFVATYSKGAWSVAPHGIEEKNTTTLTSTSCVADFCMVTGYYYENGRTVGLAYIYENGTWRHEAGLASSAPDLLGVSEVDCIAPSYCAVTGSYGDPRVSIFPVFGWYKNGAWAFDLQAYKGRALNLGAMDCAGVQCSAVLGQVGTSKVFRNENESWDQVADLEVLPEAGRYPYWEAISCPQADRCVAAGRTDFGFAGARGLLVNETDQGWEDTVVSEFSEGSEFWFLDVSCVSVNSCMAVGLYDDRVLGRSTLVAEFDGVRWHAYNPLRQYGQEPQPDVPTGSFVAFGDSLTTGGSIQNCNPNRHTSPWGCTGDPAAPPYPDLVKEALGFDSENYRRVGIWGYTAQEAAHAHANGRNTEGEWTPQLTTIEEADGLVIGALGVNDLQFSNVLLWARKYFQPGDQVSATARNLLAERADDFDQLFSSLRVAQNNGATVVLGLYYNPYDTPNAFCGDLENIGNRVVDTLNDELIRRAESEGFLVADFRPAFRNHGSGAADPFVFGTECKATSALIAWAPEWLGGGGGKQAVGVTFDPHPNQKGTQAMAAAIIEEIAQ